MTQFFFSFCDDIRNKVKMDGYICGPARGAQGGSISSIPRPGQFSYFTESRLRKQIIIFPLSILCPPHGIVSPVPTTKNHITTTHQQYLITTTHHMVSYHPTQPHGILPQLPTIRYHITTKHHTVSYQNCPP
jgi:hypothetical protein